MRADFAGLQAYIGQPPTTISRRATGCNGSARVKGMRPLNGNGRQPDMMHPLDSKTAMRAYPTT